MKKAVVSDSYIAKRIHDMLNMATEIESKYPLDISLLLKPFFERLKVLKNTEDNTKDNNEKLKEILSIKFELKSLTRELDKKYFFKDNILLGDIGYYEKDGKFGVVNFKSGEISENIFDNIKCSKLRAYGKCSDCIVGKIGYAKCLIWHDKSKKIFVNDMADINNIFFFSWGLKVSEERIESGNFYPYFDDPVVKHHIINFDRDSRMYMFTRSAVLNSKNFTHQFFYKKYRSKYNYTGPFYENSFNASNNAFLEVEHDCIRFRVSVLFAMERRGKWGVVSSEDEIICPFKYDNVLAFHDGLAMVEKNGKWGYINKEGKEVCPAKYDEAVVFYNGYAIVKLNGKWHYLTNKDMFD